jgi:hypothetical protein
MWRSHADVPEFSPIISPASVVPVIEPDVDCGQAGFAGTSGLPAGPPQSHVITLELTPTWAKWMWANRGGPVNPVQVSVQFSVVPSSLSVALKLPWLPMALGGTSLKDDNREENRVESPESCARTPMLARPAAAVTNNIAIVILNMRLFIEFLLEVELD